MFPLLFHLQLHQVLFPIKLGLFHFSLLLKLVINLFLGPLAFVKHYVICKAVMSCEPVAVNVNFAPVSVCQCVNVVRSVFCHLHVFFLVKPLFTTVNLVGRVTVYVKPVNSPHHIRRVFPSVHCTTGIHQNFSYWRHENVTSFPLPSSNLLLLLLLNLIFHLWLRSLIFHQDLHFLLETHLLQTFNMCHHQLKFAYFLWLCSVRSYRTSQHNIY